MNKPFQRALFLFRRDLRLEDNTGLTFALKNAREVIAGFIFTPEQIEHNPYKNLHCLQFMIESLEDLEKTLQQKSGKLFLFFGHPEDVVEKCILNLKVDAVVVNRDYTPYSTQRDKKMESACKSHHIPFLSFDDALLHPPEDTLKADGKPYSIFTPFYRNACKLEVPPPVTNPYQNYYTDDILFSTEKNILEKIVPTRSTQASGGRSAALKILKDLVHYSSYKKLRDFPAKEGTTHLSAHLKFTTCSPREVYHAISNEFGNHSELIRSLYWRDFFTGIAYYFPHVFLGAFRKQFDRIKWNNDNSLFTLWCEGKTGFPLVDAGMREMNQTGFMHNRVRMLAASFLVKDLHIDWRWGEKYFAKTLIDYDPAVNNGNWQWAASTGCDAQPYFRIFNPWTQQINFDADCTYIKKWVPELSEVPPQAIHYWHLEKYRHLSLHYPKPIVDHSQEAKESLEAYRKFASINKPH